MTPSSVAPGDLGRPGSGLARRRAGQARCRRVDRVLGTSSALPDAAVLAGHVVRFPLSDDAFAAVLTDLRRALVPGTGAGSGCRTGPSTGGPPCGSGPKRSFGRRSGGPGSRSSPCTEGGGGRGWARPRVNSSWSRGAERARIFPWADEVLTGGVLRAESGLRNTAIGDFRQR
ncbi:hypothetical protein GCM10010428_01680 [Actinosynnema pretiosum subsp. pretiosum]